MKQKSTTLKLFLISLFIMAGYSVKAQVTTLSQLSPAAGVFCPTVPVTLTAASTNAVSYVWTRYSGTTATGTATPIAGTTSSLSDLPADPGYYTYVSTGVNADGCTSTVSDPIVVYVLPPITASIASNKANADNHYCVSSVPTGSDAIILTATAGKGGTAVSETFGYTYQWYKGATLIAGATGATYTMNTTNDNVVGANAYTVQVNYAVKTCTAQASNGVTITVNDVPGKPVVTITP